jgi:hypothetical protein
MFKNLLSELFHLSHFLFFSIFYVNKYSQAREERLAGGSSAMPSLSNSSLTEDIRKELDKPKIPAVSKDHGREGATWTPGMSSEAKEYTAKAGMPKKGTRCTIMLNKAISNTLFGKRITLRWLRYQIKGRSALNE